MDYTERLRRLAINDARFAEEGAVGAGAEPRELDPKTLALVRLAALVAVGGAVPSYGAHADAALHVVALADRVVGAAGAVAELVDLAAFRAALQRVSRKGKPVAPTPEPELEIAVNATDPASPQLPADALKE